MTDLSAFDVTGIDNPSYQYSKTRFNNLLNAIETIAGSVVTPEQYGAVGDGVTNDGPAFAAAIAYLKTIAVNVSANGFYKGSPTLKCGGKHYYLGTTTLDITHTLTITGETVNAQTGGTKLRWAAGATGIRIQRYNTSGASTIDGVTHFGGDGTILRGLYLVGGYAGTEGEFHAIHAKARFFVEHCLIDNWQGDGIHAWAEIGGGASYEGELSTSRIERTSIRSCRIGADVRGADANVVSLNEVEFVGNRQAGYVDDSDIGTNSLRNAHATNNGVGTAGWIPTQSSYLGNRFAVRWGQEAGASTNAPPATATDNTWWYYIEAGGADIPNSIIAWTSGLTWRAGGAYVTADASAIVLLDNCYAEDGQFSQFGGATLLLAGAITERYRRGGSRIRSVAGVVTIDGGLTATDGVFTGASIFGPATGTSDGVTIYRSTSTSHTQQFTVSGTTVREEFGYSGIGALSKFYNTWQMRYGPTNTTILLLDSTGGDLKDQLKINATKVIGPRKTGWAVATGTATRTTFDTASVTLPQLAERVKALVDDLHGTAGHGLIGT